MNIHHDAELKEINREYQLIAQQYRAGKINNAQLLKARAETEKRRLELDSTYA